MRLYFAGAFHQAIEQKYIKYKLYSFVREKQNAINFGSKGLLLDSGAFTEFTLNKPVDINALIKFIEEFKPENAIQLDKIGDEEETWNRFKFMDKRVKVLPVIHHKASVKHINRVLDLENDYICLGGLVPLSSKHNHPKLISWCDYLYSSFPKLRSKKVHCLGIMNKVVLSRYPFYSADSSTWLAPAKFPRDQDRLTKFRQKVFWTTKDKNMNIDIYGRLLLPEIKKQQELEKYLTNLWINRGIK